jgi:hypothetical protein
VADRGAATASGDLDRVMRFVVYEVTHSIKTYARRAFRWQKIRHRSAHHYESARPKSIHKSRPGLNDILVLSKPCQGRSLNRNKTIIGGKSDQG